VSIKFGQYLVLYKFWLVLKILALAWLWWQIMIERFGGLALVWLAK
jgi:hypothetical protein